MVFAEKSPLYGHHPLAAYRLYFASPDTKLVLTYRNPVSRTCSRFRKHCPTKRQQERGHQVFQGWENDKMHKDLDFVALYRRCRVRELHRQLCPLNGTWPWPPSEDVVAAALGMNPATTAATSAFDRRDDGAASAQEACTLVPQLLKWPPREPGKVWPPGFPPGNGKPVWDSHLPEVPGEVVAVADRIMSDLLFSGAWTKHEARVVEENMYFSCNHRFRKIGYSFFPHLYPEHLRRWFYLFPRDHILLSAQEDLLDRPSHTMAALYRHVGLDPAGDESIAQDALRDPNLARGQGDMLPRGPGDSPGSLHKSRSGRDRGKTAFQSGQERCNNSAVDPLEAMRVLGPSMRDFYHIIGRNLSWESVAVSSKQEAPTCETYR